MYTLGYYPANGTLATQNTTISFDSSTGYAIIKNLAITKFGMYVTTLNVYTDNNDYNFQCYSNPIQIKTKKSTIPIYDSSKQPDYIIKFNGSYDSINPVEIKASVYNYMNSYGLNIGGMSCYSGSVYVAFYSTDSSVSLINNLILSGLNISSSLTFVSASVSGTSYTCTNCSIIIVNNINNNISSKSNSSSSFIDSNSNVNSSNKQVNTNFT